MKAFAISVILSLSVGALAGEIGWYKALGFKPAKCSYFENGQFVREVSELQCREDFLYDYFKDWGLGGFVCTKLADMGKRIYGERFFPVRHMPNVYCEKYKEDFQSAVRDFENGVIQDF